MKLTEEMEKIDRKSMVCGAVVLAGGYYLYQKYWNNNAKLANKKDEEDTAGETSESE